MSEKKHPEHKYSVTFVSIIGTIFVFLKSDCFMGTVLQKSISSKYHLRIRFKCLTMNLMFFFQQSFQILLNFLCRKFIDKVTSLLVSGQYPECLDCILRCMKQSLPKTIDDCFKKYIWKNFRKIWVFFVIPHTPIEIQSVWLSSQ